MIESLCFARSKILQELLALYFSNTGRRYYLRELERLLGYSAGNIRRELLKLQRDDLLKTQRIGNLLYYSLNQNHPLFEELKSIVSKTIGVEASLKAALSTLANVKAAFIFGSFASKSERETSDVDVMIIGEPDVSQLNRKIRELEQKLRREINPFIYSWRDYQAKKKARTGFIVDLLRSPKIMLVGIEDDL
ncbi:MAG: nucleotidyltransferase domain-containing protein [Clostridiales bacterium]|nr:nucleotidyltransferase domain-containing protein [Clostridiales bacterium]